MLLIDFFTHLIDFIIYLLCQKLRKLKLNLKLISYEKTFYTN